MNAALTPPSDAEPAPALDLEARRALLEKYGEKIRPRLFALALAFGAPEDRAEEVAQRVLFRFLDGERTVRIDPANEYESLAVLLLGAARSALDTRTREFRGRVNVTTTGNERF